MIDTRSTLTPAQYEEMQYAEREGEKARSHERIMAQVEIDGRKELKKLELDLRTTEATKAVELRKLELETTRLEIRWNQLLKVPKFLVLLPILPFFGIALCISIFRDKDLPVDFWKFLR